MKYEIVIQTDHFQFFLEDSQAHTDTSTIWTVEEVSQGIVSRQGFLAVSTIRYGGETRVIVEALKARPTQLPTSCERLVQCSIEIQSGKLRVSAPECSPKDVIFLSLAPGTYEALVCFANLNTVEDEFALNGLDYYRIVIWPG